MSYDVTICADETFSRSVQFAPLADFIATLRRVQPNGERGFVLSEGKRIWMEIDLEEVNDEGDILDDYESSTIVNCVRLHIPYPMLGDHPDRDYFPIAIEIARHLGWQAIDDQTGEPLRTSSAVAGSKADQKPWWKFW